MSALSGLRKDAGGRITLSALAPTSYYRGMGIAGGALCATTVGANLKFNGSVFVDGVGGGVFTDGGGAIASYSGGLPLTAAGALATSTGFPTSYDQGVGFTAAGRVAAA